MNVFKASAVHPERSSSGPNYNQEVWPHQFCPQISAPTSCRSENWLWNSSVCVQLSPCVAPKYISSMLVLYEPAQILRSSRADFLLVPGLNKSVLILAATIRNNLSGGVRQTSAQTMFTQKSILFRSVLTSESLSLEPFSFNFALYQKLTVIYLFFYLFSFLAFIYL